MTAALSRWCAPLSVTPSLPDESTIAQLESGVRGNSPAPFGAGERLQGPTYRYLKLGFGPNPYHLIGAAPLNRRALAGSHQGKSTHAHVRGVQA